MIIDDLTKQERKALMKEAMKEWLNEQRIAVEVTVGRWFLRAVASIVIVAILYFVLWMNGWQR